MKVVSHRARKVIDMRWGEKTLNNVFKRLVGIILILSIALGAVPLDAVYGQEDFTVTEINLYRTFGDLSDIGTYGISIGGIGLSKVTISYQEEATDNFIPLINPMPGSDDYFRQFRIEPGIIVSKLRVGNKVFNINETDMPKINGIDPEQVDTVRDEEVKFRGKNFDNFTVDDGATADITIIEISNNDLTEIFKNSNQNGEVTLKKDELLKLGNGIKHITITQKSTQHGADVVTTYNQRNAFRIYEDIGEKEATIYPNRGKIGTEVSIAIKKDQYKYSVFFLEDETKPFRNEYMGEEPEYIQTTNNDGIIRLRVPKSVQQGRTYKVVITNNLDAKKGPGKDLTNDVTKQKTIGEFYVVDAEVGPAIEKVVPKEGTSAGSYVTIYGYRFEELKINGLDKVDDTVPPADTADPNSNKLEILSGGQDDPTKLRINYYKDNNDPDITYNGKLVKELTRDFLVTIGRDALFEEEHKDKNIFIKGDSQEDKLYVKTKTIDRVDLKDPIKDVVIEIATTIKTEDEEYIFTEVATLPEGYTFLPSHQDPQIDKVTPGQIQVEESGMDYKTKDKTILSIQGRDFNVFRYVENGDMKTNYPKVVIGGSGEDNAEIIIEKNADGRVYYYKKGASGEWERPTEPTSGAIFEVLDKNGLIVNGVNGNEVGNSIVVTIPKDMPVSTINKPLPVAVSNPKRNSKDRGIYGSKNDVVSFVTVLSSPIIENVDPYIVTVEGGEDAVIKGRNFDDGIKVFIDGSEVPNVARDIDRETTKGTLKFRVPRGREGINIIQVVNPDGGSDTHEFIYVQTMKINPKITSIAPPKGTKDTLVIIKGDNFLKPDQTIGSIEGLGIYKLIGSRIFLGDEDVNKYTAGQEKLGDYGAPKLEKESLFRIEKDPDRLILSPYYKSATLSENSGENDGDDGNYYRINIDYEGSPVIIGKDERYTIKLIDGCIKAVDNVGETFDTDLTENVLTIKNSDEEVIKEIKISFNYKLFSIGKNEFGSGYLRVADYYDSLILKDHKDGDENYKGNFYVIEIDDTEKVILSDGKSNIYEIRLKDNYIVAVKDNDIQVVEVNGDSIKIGDKIFKFKTPFAVDPDTGVIIGHRAKVKNKNEIWVTIPGKSLPGSYDVTVRNPDTKSFTVKKGFEYLNPQSKPKINYISPSQGSVDGGYEIIIYGEDFQNTTEIYIAGEKIPYKDTEVDKVNYKSITVTVPKYPGDVDADFKTDKKFVPVTVLNEDGGSVSTDNLFAYVVAASRPRIDKINPTKGTAAGGDLVEIWGYDFRYFEPYKGEEPRDGDSNFEDLDRNGKWTRYSGDEDVPAEFRKELDHKDLKEYIDSPVLPTVYFGNQKAKIVEFAAGRIKVISPGSAILGNVDVYILNNDAGTSNKIRFTYEGSNPNIRAIIPNVGRRQGGEKVNIEGSNFKVNNIDIIDKEGKTSGYLVRFGEISNIQIPREAENSGLINQGSATVNLAGGLRVEHKIEDGSNKIIVSITESGTTYTQKYSYDSGIKYIDVRGLKDKDDNDNNYKGNELIKVEVDDGRLLVTRGYSPQVEERFIGHLEVVTPTYYSVGNVDVTVENPDGISNKVVYQYKNPDSDPRITNITRDGQQPQLANNGENKILTVNAKGGSMIAIEGSDFRDVQRIQIGNALNIESKDILIEEPNRLVFKMPAVADSVLTFMHRIVVINYDGGTASSDEIYPPIYIQFTKGESSPQIEEITPPRGADTGGNTVIIKGKDFREVMDGFEEEKLKVYFDGNQVPNSDVRVIDYKTISVIAPPGKPGPVEVKIENPDGEMSNTVQYTYASNPRIISVLDPLDSAEKAIISAISIEGGQEIKLKGTGFMANAKVYFAPKITPVTGSGGNSGKIIYIEGNPYILEEGMEGTEYNFTDAETVTIKTPPLKAGSLGIIIVNPDDGASPIYTNLIYGLPEIAAPSNVVAELVYDRFIRVHWGAVSGATQYEIFVVTDDTKTELIGSTRLTSFAYSDLRPRTRYKFVVKAVGGYGSSEASRESNTVRTGSVVGPPDEDGKPGENTSMVKTGNVANVVIGTKDKGITPVIIDLTGGSLAGSTEIVISMPAGVIMQNGNRNVQVMGKDFSLNFKLSAFNVAAVRENSAKTDTGVRFVVAPNKGNTQVASGNGLSTVYNLDATVYVGKENTVMDYLAGPLNLVLDYDLQKADLRKLNYAGFSHFNPETNSWQSVGSPINTAVNFVSGTVNRLGGYAVIGSRR